MTQKRINVFVGSPDTDAALRKLTVDKIWQWDKLNPKSEYIFIPHTWSDDCPPQTPPTPCDGQFCITTLLIDKCDLLIALIIDGTGTPYVKDGQEFPCATLYETYYNSRINKKKSYIFLNKDDTRTTHFNWIIENGMGLFWQGDKDKFEKNIFERVCQIFSFYIGSNVKPITGNSIRHVDAPAQASSALACNVAPSLDLGDQRQAKEREAAERAAKESSFDVAQLSDAELELLVAVLLRKAPVTYQANKLEFHINDNTVVPFTFDTPLPENQTVNDVLKSLIAFNFLEKLGALYRASRLAQEHRNELIARDNKRILDVLLRTSFGKLVLNYADGKAARISVNVSKTLPYDKCDIVLQKNGDFEHPHPGFNFSTKIALVHEVNAVAVILHKNLLINNWEAQENAGTPPYSQRNLSENGGFPIQSNISPYSGQLIRCGINARNSFSNILKFDYVTSCLTERGCEISRLYLAWNQGDN